MTTKYIQESVYVQKNAFGKKSIKKISIQENVFLVIWQKCIQESG